MDFRKLYTAPYVRRQRDSEPLACQRVHPNGFDDASPSAHCYADPMLCGVEIADTGLQTGQGMHGGFSRADTQNDMAAIGPSFKEKFVDDAPVNTADIGKTIAAVLDLSPEDKGSLVGRVLAEARRGDAPIPSSLRKECVSDPGIGALRTVLRYQTVGDTAYFDVAGFKGRTIGLDTSGDPEFAKSVISEDCRHAKKESRP